MPTWVCVLSSRGLFIPSVFILGTDNETTDVQSLIMASRGLSVPIRCLRNMDGYVSDCRQAVLSRHTLTKDSFDRYRTMTLLRLSPGVFLGYKLR